MGLTFDLN